MSTLIENGYPIYTDANGNPLDDGYIFIGEAGLNPITNPLQAYWDAELTIPAVNIRTQGGYPVYNGSPGRLYVEDSYSILIQDTTMQTIYLVLDAVDFFSVPSSNPGYDGSQVIVKNANEVTVKEGSLIDVGGIVVTVFADVDFTLPIADTDYFIKISPVGAMTLQTSSGTFDVDNNGLYDGDDRVLNWVVYKDASAAYTIKIIDPQNLLIVAQDIRKTEPLEVAALTATSVSTDGVALKTKVIEIGDWDMATNATILIAHGLSEYKKVRSISAIVRDDGDVEYYSIAYGDELGGVWRPAGAVMEVDSTDVKLAAFSGGWFSGLNPTSFNSTGFNRGWLTIVYEA